MIVRCAQFGKCITAKVCELSNLDGDPVSKHELVTGASLLLEVNKKSYPVTFIGNEGSRYSTLALMHNF